MKRTVFLLLLTFLLVSCNPFTEFDSEKVTNQIFLESGAVHSQAICAPYKSLVLDVEDSSMTCGIHRSTPGNVREEITKILRWSGARADGNWEAEMFGYARTYKYDKTGSYTVIVTPSSLIITDYNFGF